MSSTTPDGVGAPPPPPQDGHGSTTTAEPFYQATGQPQPTGPSPYSETDEPAEPQPAEVQETDPGTTSTAGTSAQGHTGSAGPRRVRLAVSRVDPWSAMKLSFLLSVAIGIMLVVATAIAWFVLDAMQVFASVEELLMSIGSEQLLELLDYVAFDRIMSFAVIVAVFDVLLLTALGTIMAFLYNIVAALVGGLHLTLTDD